MEDFFEQGALAARAEHTGFPVIDEMSEVAVHLSLACHKHLLGHQSAITGDT